MPGEPVLYVGDRLYLNRDMARILLDMLPEGHEESLEVLGVLDTAKGKMLVLRNPAAAIEPTEAP